MNDHDDHIQMHLKLFNWEDFNAKIYSRNPIKRFMQKRGWLKVQTTRERLEAINKHIQSHMDAISGINSVVRGEK